MNDEEALKATAELVAKIMLECKKYAERDGLDFLFVVQTTAEAMLKIINQTIAVFRNGLAKGV